VGTNGSRARFKKLMENCRSGLVLKIADFFIEIQKFQKNKKSEKLCKKLDEILRTLVENFFKSRPF
jgi:hypothetical protein